MNLRKKEGSFMKYVQNFIPFENHLFLSALVALIPIAFFFWALAIKRMAAYKASLFTLLISLVISVIVYKMPITLPIMSATQGAIYGIIPIGWIIGHPCFCTSLRLKPGNLILFETRLYRSLKIDVYKLYW